LLLVPVLAGVTIEVELVAGAVVVLGIEKEDAAVVTAGAGAGKAAKVNGAKAGFAVAGAAAAAEAVAAGGALKPVKPLNGLALAAAGAGAAEVSPEKDLNGLLDASAGSSGLFPKDRLMTNRLR
jgi:hypothetical protein